MPLKRGASLLWFAAFSVCGSRFLLGEKGGFHQGGVVDRLFGADKGQWAEGRWAYVNIKAGTKDYRPLASGGSREKKNEGRQGVVWMQQKSEVGTDLLVSPPRDEWQSGPRPPRRQL